MSRSTFASFADALGPSASASTILSHDWSASPVGPVASWQQHLKTTIAMVVRCPTPMALLWGEDGMLIYNDGYAKVLGNKHPLALGRPVRDVWPEAADFNLEVLDKVSGGESLSYRDQFFVLERDGQSQRCWFDLDYCPVFDDTTIVGVLALVHEKTEMMLMSRQLEQEREQFVELFAHAPGFLAVLNGPEHRIERINPGYAQLVGFGLQMAEMSHENEQLLGRLTQMSTTDAMTGLFNRRHGEYLLELEVRRARRYKLPLALIVFDVDGFKAINDQFGHPVGDVAIRSVAEAAQAALRTTDVLVRSGGEEFHIIAPHTSAIDALKVAEKIRVAIAATEIPGCDKVTVSLGVGQASDQETPDALTVRVDAALARAKRKGRNCVELAMS